jgi:hypothetical protein
LPLLLRTSSASPPPSIAPPAGRGAARNPAPSLAAGSREAGRASTAAAAQGAQGRRNRPDPDGDGEEEEGRPGPRGGGVSKASPFLPRPPPISSIYPGGALRPAGGIASCRGRGAAGQGKAEKRRRGA